MTPSILAERHTARLTAPVTPADAGDLFATPAPHRVALVTEYYYPHMGGVCEHVHFLARELRRRGHHVDIITSALGQAPDEPGLIRMGHSVPVYSNGSLARITVGAGLRRTMRATLRDGRYDVVHVHSPLTPTLPMLAVREARVPVVGTIHTYFPRSFAYQLLRPVFQSVLDRIDAVIGVSETAIRAHARYFHADWRVIPNGVDLDFFRWDAPRPSTLEPGVRHVLFLGRLDPRNGLATLIAAFQRLHTERTVRLVVAGDGPLRDHYERLAGGDPNILFVGSVVAERPGYYANCDVYACPTTKASFGITLLEAMACGAPIVCSDIVGFRDVVRNGCEALMVPCGDERALANALARVLDDPGVRARLGMAGQACVARYAWPNVTDEVVAVYDEVTASKSVRR
jgi:phosphatidylinositol alpha-mannosyltransferase